MSSIGDLMRDGVIRSDVPLAPLTTYKLGGPAALFAEIEDMESLGEVIDSGVTRDRPVLVLGRGSNLVVADDGFDGLAIRLGEGFNQIGTRGSEIAAGSAVPLARLARHSVDHGFRGLEFFVGIPGSVGGAVRQNAGCFGCETKDRLIGASVVDLESGTTRSLDTVGLELSYRHSNLGPTDLVVEALFQVERGDPERGRREMRRITRWRRDHQPGGTLNAGSVFKNPSGISAGELIDKLGLKGHRVGDATVSEKHANFFVAGPEATSRDVYLLVQDVKDRVFELSGTILEPEINFVGFEA